MKSYYHEINIYVFQILEQILYPYITTFGPSGAIFFCGGVCILLIVCGYDQIQTQLVTKFFFFQSHERWFPPVFPTCFIFLLLSCVYIVWVSTSPQCVSKLCVSLLFLPWDISINALGFLGLVYSIEHTVLKVFF